MIHCNNINDGDDAPSAGCPSVVYHGAVSQQIGFYPCCVTVVSNYVGVLRPVNRCGNCSNNNNTPQS